MEARRAIDGRLVRQASHPPLRPGAPQQAHVRRTSPLRKGVKDDGGGAFIRVCNRVFIGLRLCGCQRSATPAKTFRKGVPLFLSARISSKTTLSSNVSPRLPTNASTCRQTSGLSPHFFSVWIASSRIAIRVSDNGRFAMMESWARWRSLQPESGRFVRPRREVGKIMRLGRAGTRRARVSQIGACFSSSPVGSIADLTLTESIEADMFMTKIGQSAKTPETVNKVVKMFRPKRTMWIIPVVALTIVALFVPAPLSEPLAADQPSLEGLDEFIVEQMKESNVPAWRSRLCATAKSFTRRVTVSGMWESDSWLHEDLVRHRLHHQVICRRVARGAGRRGETRLGQADLRISAELSALRPHSERADNHARPCESPFRLAKPRFLHVPRRLFSERDGRTALLSGVEPRFADDVSVQQPAVHDGGLPGGAACRHDMGGTHPTKSFGSPANGTHQLLCAGSQKSGDFALPYRKGNDEVKEIPHQFLNFPEEGAAGIINSNVGDMSRYLLFYLNHGNEGKSQVLSRQNMVQMQTSMIAIPPVLNTGFGPFNYGMGLNLTNYRGHK